MVNTRKSRNQVELIYVNGNFRTVLSNSRPEHISVRRVNLDDVAYREYMKGTRYHVIGLEGPYPKTIEHRLDYK